LVATIRPNWILTVVNLSGADDAVLDVETTPRNYTDNEETVIANADVIQHYNRM